MARFSGPAGPGASRTLRAVRRAEAETRQAAERARDERWREHDRAAEYIRGKQTPRVELEELVDVLNGLSVAELMWLFRGVELANTWQYGVRGFVDIADRPVDIPMPEADARQCVEDCRLLGHQQPKTLIRRVALGPWCEVTA